MDDALAQDDVAIKPRFARLDDGMGGPHAIIKGRAGERHDRPVGLMTSAAGNDLPMHGIDPVRIGTDGRPEDRFRHSIVDRQDGEHGIDPRPLWYSPDDWIDFGQPLETWIEDTADALAQAIVAAASVLDFSAVVIDGGFPGWVRERVVAAAKRAIGALDLQGVVLPEIVEGAAGSQARALGGASLPLFSRYLLDQNVLFKELA